MLLLLFLQTPAPTPTVVHIPERMPALFTLIYLGGLLLLVLLLIISLLLNRRRGIVVSGSDSGRPSERSEETARLNLN